MVIVKLHGCSGAGKTTATRELMSHYTFESHRSDKKIVAYTATNGPWGRPLAVLGSYENNCGGMDTISTAAQGVELVDKYASKGFNVLHEGLLQSTYYGAAGKSSEKYGNEYVFAFLDTPVDLCIERVLQRREEQGSKNKFDPTLTMQKHETILRLCKRLIAMGRRVEIVNHKNPVDHLLCLFK